MCFAAGRNDFADQIWLAVGLENPDIDYEQEW